MKELDSLKTFLSSPKKIVITTHANPDADALGSSLGLHHFLKNRGHLSTVITPTDYPEFLHWMEGHEEVLADSHETHNQCVEIINEADLICCLDFNGFKRIKKLEEPVKNAPGKILLVDHHLNKEMEADFELWDDKAAATAELIFDLIKLMDGESEINRAIAEALYAGIMTDTGSFKHGSTSAKIHRTVADLMDHGVDVNKVSRLIYDTNSLNRLRFIGYALMEKLVVNMEHKVAYFVINAEEHERFHLKSGDTEGLVNYALSIKGIVIAAIIMEKNGEVKMSFRSVGNYAVNDFAATHFNGGGHKNAAGGLSDLNLDATVDKFKSLIPELQHTLI
jgi:phosphoesterase RecJ-like protein